MEAVCEIYGIDDPTVALERVTDLADTMTDVSYGPEVHQLGGPLRRWPPRIAAWHRSRESNAATEAANNLAKRIKRVAFGMTNFVHWRVRVLLYASAPHWSKLATICHEPRELPKNPIDSASAASQRPHP